MAAIGNNFITLTKDWTALKSVASSRRLPIQFDEDEDSYEIFLIDNPVVWLSRVYKGAVPGALQSTYSQAQNDADLSDFENNYKANANKPLNPRSESGTVVVTSEDGGTVNPRIEHWLEDEESVEEGVWETLWVKAGPGIFWNAVFQLNSDDFEFRVIVDGVELFTVSLSEIKNDYDLKDADEVVWDVHQYKPNKWKYSPSTPIRFSTEVRFEFSSEKNTKKVVRGMSNWGPTE